MYSKKGFIKGDWKTKNILRIESGYTKVRLEKG
jgi:hypothetical protein